MCPRYDRERRRRDPFLLLDLGFSVYKTINILSKFLWISLRERVSSAYRRTWVNGKKSVRGTRIFIGFLLAVASLTSIDCRAADLPAGMTLQPVQQRYYVIKDAFMREAPDTSAARVGGVTKGQEVSVTGRAVYAKSKGNSLPWLQIKRTNGSIGYVFGDALVPMIDGTLPAPLEGKLEASGHPDCRYIVSIESKNPVPDEAQQTADYNVAMACKLKDGEIAFGAGMFITEMPYQKEKELYQINVDLWDMPITDEDILSVTALYDPNANKVSFDRVNDPNFAKGAGIAPMNAQSVPAALAGALAIAHKAWQPAVWDTLVKTRDSDDSNKSDD